MLQKLVLAVVGAVAAGDAHHAARDACLTEAGAIEQSFGKIKDEALSPACMAAGTALMTGIKGNHTLELGIDPAKGSGAVKDCVDVACMEFKKLKQDQKCSKAVCDQLKVQLGEIRKVWDARKGVKPEPETEPETEPEPEKPATPEPEPEQSAGNATAAGNSTSAGNGTKAEPETEKTEPETETKGPDALKLGLWHGINAVAISFCYDDVKPMFAECNLESLVPPEFTSAVEALKATITTTTTTTTTNTNTTGTVTTGARTAAAVSGAVVALGVVSRFL